MKIKIPKIKIVKKRLPSKKVIVDFVRNINLKKLLTNLKNHKTILVTTVILLVLLNYLSLQYFIRLDTTDSQNFSISSTTKEIITSLEKNVTIEVYFSDNIPPNLTEARQNVLDLLEEYAEGGGHPPTKKQKHRMVRLILI